MVDLAWGFSTFSWSDWLAITRANKFCLRFGLPSHVTRLFTNLRRTWVKHKSRYNHEHCIGNNGLKLHPQIPRGHSVEKHHLKPHFRFLFKLLKIPWLLACDVWQKNKFVNSLHKTHEWRKCFEPGLSVSICPCLTEFRLRNFEQF